MTNSNENKRTKWSGEVDNVHPFFEDCLSTSMNYKAMQVAIAGNVVDTLTERGLFSTVLHTDGTDRYSIALRSKPEYRLSNVVGIRVNFNRFNISFILTNLNDECDFGIFRFKTIIGMPVKCTFTGNIQYSVAEDVNLIEELKEIFYIAEMNYNNDIIRNVSYDGTIDFNNITIYDLCQMYLGDCKIASKLADHGYKDMSVTEFVNNVDLDGLRKEYGIGPKTVVVLKDMYMYFGLDEIKNTSKKKGLCLKEE